MTPRTAAADTWTITLRSLAHWARQPGPVAVALLFPVMVALMMGYLFGGQMDVPGGGGYREFIMPGMFAMTMLFGVETTFAAVASDRARGVTDRFRAMPVAPSAPVAGRAVADMLHGAVALAVMIGCGLLVGWRWHDGAGRALAGLGLLLLLRFALVWTGVYLGLVASGPEAVVVAQVLVWPVGFLSSALIAPETMPGWLGAIAEWNPLSATVTACRDLFGDTAPSGGWAADHALALAVVWPLLISGVFAVLSVRRYGRR
ncbi:Daunorubicin/doxorubicin resistance ABC transporter permease protein DrrB [Actinomadura rubteroloni]|uniref:Transport permease protein n=1 Tax=Actinomadura rubteroloni TaxID=1926885 RepID=A0A2P4UNE5_9ACTN|nr:ABC transporter permease [Actinomadura rubteroloni]POM26574.1 Daunorubicin/doxorubicin resistance ABC transporter permease protein DrrB [Actinomadura rubteroloni]